VVAYLIEHLFNTHNYYSSCFTHTSTLHSFTTRRSSDLASVIMEEINRNGGNSGVCHGQMYNMGTLLRHGSKAQKDLYLPKIASRSEEHTSELQSRFDLVCRLLLEKKKSH